MKGPGSLFLILMALLATTIFALAYVPWSRTGTPWRPDPTKVSPSVGQYWDEATLIKGREFRSGGYGRYFRRKGIVGLLLIAVLLSGRHLALRALPKGVFGATLAILLAFVVLDFVAIPFGLEALHDARAYGLSKQSVGFWFSDHYKDLAITLVTTAVVVLVLLFLMHRFPRTWPLPATILTAIGSVLMAFVIPLVVDPIFNKFTPLENPDLKARFLEIARKGGVPAKEVLVSDASRRTTALNAYFTGFGPTRRIVVYDTLVESLQPDEAELVVAHEVGHWAKAHIAKGLVLMTIGVAFGLILLKAFLDWVFRNNVYGIRGPFDPALAPLVLLLYWFALFVELPIENFISRKMEAEADLYALQLTGDAETQIRAEVAIDRKNLDDVVPPPFVKALLYTHPAAVERVAQAEQYRALHPQPPKEITP